MQPLSHGSTRHRQVFMLHSDNTKWSAAEEVAMRPTTPTTTPDRAADGDENGRPENEEGDANLGAAERRTPENPGRGAHIRNRVAQTPDGHTNLRHMPTLRAALGRGSLSFNDVELLPRAPPGHAIMVPQSPGGSLPLALAVAAEAARLP